MKLKNILLSLLLGLTISGTATTTPETPSQNSLENSRAIISTETDMPLIRLGCRVFGLKICFFFPLKKSLYARHT